MKDLINLMWFLTLFDICSLIIMFFITDYFSLSNDKLVLFFLITKLYSTFHVQIATCGCAKE